MSSWLLLGPSGLSKDGSSAAPSPSFCSPLFGPLNFSSATSATCLMPRRAPAGERCRAWAPEPEDEMGLGHAW